MRHPEIAGMAEQHDLALVFRAEPQRHGLGSHVLGIDAMNDLLKLESGERPVDRSPRRLDGIPLAAKFLRNSPADFEAGPDRRKERADTPDDMTGGLFLDHEQSKAVKHPVSRHDRPIAPADHLLGDRLAAPRHYAPPV